MRTADANDANSNDGAIEPWCDFYSRSFDASRALAAKSKVKPPRPNARALDTVRQCARVLAACGVDVRDSERDFVRAANERKEIRHRDVTSFAAQARAKARAEKFQKQEEAFATRERVTDALARVASAKNKGPLMVLFRARCERIKVRVVTRHSHGVRGVAEAYVEAFDKFMNLILTDVEETYATRTKRDVARDVARDDDGATTRRVRRVVKLEHRTRRIAQVFVRGEQIVSVSIPPSVDEPSAAVDGVA